MKTWKNAIVGVGVIGDWHVSLVKALPQCDLVAVCDLDEAKAKKSLAKYGLEHVPVYADEKSMLDRHSEIEIVHVCTPSGAHADPAVLAMEAGKHVIVEKPLEITLPKIDRMIETSIKRNVRLAGIFQNRWNPANRALFDAARNGRFGTITFAASYTPWYRTDQYYRDGGWRGTWALDGGGAMMNQSVHSVDLIQWIAGPVKQVSAYASSLIHPEIEVEDTLASAVVFDNGAFGHISGSTAMYPGGAVRVEVGGSDGSAISESGLKMYKFRGDEASQAKDKAFVEATNATRSQTSGGGSSPTDMPHELHYQNITHILDRWEANQDADTSGPEARKAVAIILALYESARKGGTPVMVSR
jgi:UDP-N-acetyl-2-amino-2-deoxyglucuronate dehydrogenase